MPPLDSLMTSAALVKSLVAFSSASDRMIFALASLVASASAAMARCSCFGSRESFLKGNRRLNKRTRF